MNFVIHNKLEIFTKTTKYVYFNTILNSLYQTLANSEKYNEFLAIGTGEPNQSKQSEFHLTNPILTLNLTNKSFQSNISCGSLFAIYEFVLENNHSNITTIKEVGLSNNSQNPIIYNYFSLISQENPDGLNVENDSELLFKVTINLSLSETPENIFTSGNNPFIEFLLGNGIGDIYVCKGSNFSNNDRIQRQNPINEEKYLCNKNFTFDTETLSLNINKTVNIGELDEILFLTNNIVFARRNIKEFYSSTQESISKNPKSNYVIKIDEDLKSVNSITNLNTQTQETNCHISKYANSFGDIVSLPFNNMFNVTTPRFLSKDANKIFFILDDKVFGYQNNNFSLKQIITTNIDDSYIQKIISFGNYIFIYSKIRPFLSTYVIENNIAIKKQNNFQSFEHFDEFENLNQTDITQANNGSFMLGYINNSANARTIYFNYTNNEFCIDSYISNSNEFSQMLAMLKNNFCDAQILYLKEGDYSITSRLVSHFPNKTETDVYSSLAYILLHNTKQLECKNRAVIAKKSTSPSLVIYYYPQVYEYELPLISDELDNYISTNLNYIIQKKEDNQFNVYNLVGYDVPEAFTNSLSDYIDTENIEDFEFLDDTLLIFQNNKDNNIVAINFKLNKTQVENVSSKTDSYLLNVSKYNKVGSNDQSVTITLNTEINV